MRTNSKFVLISFLVWAKMSMEWHRNRICASMNFASSLFAILDYELHKHIFSYLTGKGWETNQGMVRSVQSRWVSESSKVSVANYGNARHRRKVGTIHSTHSRSPLPSLCHHYSRSPVFRVVSGLCPEHRARLESSRRLRVESQTRVELRMPEQWLLLHYTLTERQQ